MGMEKIFAFDESNIPALKTLFSKGCALAVGSFDGVHIGHRALLGAASSFAHSHGMPAAAVTFLPEDRPKQGSLALAQPQKKRELLLGSGADFVVELPYSMVKDLQAGDFVERILCGALNCRRAFCGGDFRFGSAGAGDSAMLRDLLSARGAGAEIIPPVTLDGSPVSSTRIRGAVNAGDMPLAKQLLGRDYSFAGVIAKGMRLASRLGVPTANLPFPQELEPPAYGVYAAVCRIGAETVNSVLNIGVKPTVGGFESPICEPHLFGFTGDIYGEECEVGFIKFIRGEKKFASVDALAKQISRDIVAAEQFFGLEEQTR